MHLSRDISGSYRKGMKLEPDLISLFLYPKWFIFALTLFNSMHDLIKFQELESLPSVDRYSLPKNEDVRDSEGMSST